MDYSDDLDALASLSRGPETVDRLAEIGFTPGQFATFMAMEPDQREIVLDVLAGNPGAHERLGERLDSVSLARWLLTLPAFQNVEDEDEDE